MKNMVVRALSLPYFYLHNKCLRRICNTDNKYKFYILSTKKKYLFSELLALTKNQLNERRNPYELFILR